MLIVMSDDINYRLISAVRGGNLDSVEELINSLDLRGSISPLNGFDLLLEAIQNNYTEIAKLILKNISKVDGEGLPQIIFFQTEERCSDVHSCPKISNSIQSIYTDSALLESAVINGDVELVEMLLDGYANINPLFGEHPLHVAIQNNKMEIIDLLLNRGADLNVRDSADMTPLHVACTKGQLIIAEKLLNKGASVNSAISKTKCRPGYTTLHCAVETDNQEIVALLLKSNACVNAKTKNGRTPLDIAVHNENLMIADDLLNHGATVDSVCLTLADGSVPLHLAIARGNAGLVKVLLKHGAYVNVQSGNTKTTLQFALDKNQTTIVAYVFVTRFSIHKTHRFFLLNAIDTSKEEYNDIIVYLLRNSPGIFSHIDFQNCNNRYTTIRLFLHAAIEKGFLKVVQDIFKCGVELCVLNKQAEGYTLLHAAAKNKRHEIAKLLIDYGANVDAKYKTRRTPFFYAFQNADANMTKILLSKEAKHSPDLFNAAVMTGSKEIVKMFLQISSNINVNDKDNSGDTALHCVAVFHGCDLKKAEVARLLLDNGANANIRNKNGLTPLHIAVDEGYPKLVKALLENNKSIHSLSHHFAVQDVTTNSGIIFNKIVQINAKTPCGMTALHIASRKKNEQVVKVLLKYGADINVKTQFCQSAVDMAFQYGRTNNFKSLLEYGADVNDSYVTEIIPHSSKQYTSVDGSSVFFVKPLCYILETHIIKMIAANRYVSAEKLQFVANRKNGKYRNYYKICSEEIVRMMQEKINPSVCFYDILSKGIHRLARYSRNYEIAQVFESKKLAKMFPIYSDMIEYNFRRGQERDYLLSVSLHSINFLTNYSLPTDVLIMEIFGYLTNEDLENLIEATHGSGIFR